MPVQKVGNVIPAHTRVQFATRSPTFAGSKTLQERIVNCLKGAALATGCEITYNE